jgi:hypothetical protein
MDTTVPGVKSLLVRARVSLAETAESRVLTCEIVHLELRNAAAGHVRLSGAARKHAKTCELCSDYQSELGVGRRAAAFWPLAPFALARDLLAKLGLGAGAGASAAGAGAVAGGGAAGGVCGACGTAVTTTLGAIGGKAAVAVATAGLAAAGATSIHHATSHPAPAKPAVVQQQQQSQAAPVLTVSQPTTSTKPDTTAEEKPDAVSSQPADPVPTTPTDGNGTFADNPPPAQPKNESNGGSSVPTDPATQPLHGTEPVQVQGMAEPTGTQQNTGTGPADAPTGTTGP